MLELPSLPPNVKHTLERLAFALWFAGVCALLYFTLQAQLARAAEFPNDLGAGTLLFESASGFEPADPLSTDVRVSVAGIVARVSVLQRFRNPGTEWAEAVYAFPLADDAAVDRLQMKIGDRVIEGAIHEREQAERVYSTARASGQRASLVRQSTPNLFTTAVANIAPGESIDITIEYLQTARYDAGELSLRLPMTITPRYGETDTPEQQPSALVDAAPFTAPGASNVTVGAQTAATGFAGPTQSMMLAVAGSGGSTAATGIFSTSSHQASLRVILAPGLPLAAVGARGHDVSVLKQRASDDSTSLAILRADSRDETSDHGGGDSFDTSSGTGTPTPSRNVVAADLGRDLSMSRGGAGQTGDKYIIEPTSHLIAMDRDFVLTWRPQVGNEPAVTALTETKGDTTYALLMIVPPTGVHTLPTQPRETIYVIDTSGSMGGQSIEQAKLALKDALGRLKSGDRFNIFQFNSWTSSLYRAPVTLSSDTYAKALEYVDALVSDGGTEMEPAIRAALAQPVTSGYMRQVIFLTDGAVAGETTLFTAIKSSLGDARLFTIGIGAAPNSHFMRKAAQFGRGTYTHVAKETEIANAMGNLFAKIERVALTDVLLDWRDADEIYPSQTPDLYSGEPLVVTASFPAGGANPLAVQAFGRVAGTQWSQKVTAPTESLPGIAALWARRKIEYLTDSRVDGTDEDVIRKLIVEVALEHGLVSPYTSLVAVDQTPARSQAAALERQAVGNATPQGARYTTLPQTATPGPLLRWLGILTLLLAAVVIVAGARRRAQSFSSAAY